MDKIDQFLSSKAFAVAGASTNRDKYGNKVLRCYIQNGKQVIPINPRAKEIEGVSCVGQVQDLPNEVNSLSIITPPAITLEIVKQAITKGIKHIWMQPGAENSQAIKLCEEHGINVIADGSCVLVVLHYHDH